MEFDGIRAFYSSFFTLLYFLVDVDKKSKKDAAHILYDLLQKMRGRHSKPVWNCGFIAGIQLHRMNEKKLRDLFFGILFGEKTFWGDVASPNSWYAADLSFDPVAYLALHFARSTPDFYTKNGFDDKLPHISRLDNTLSRVPPNSGLQSLDIYRKLEGASASDDEILRRHGVHQQNVPNLSRTRRESA